MNLERLTTPNLVHEGVNADEFAAFPIGEGLGNDEVGMQTNVSRSATNISWWAEDLPQIGCLFVYFAACPLIRLWIFSHLQNVGLLRPVPPSRFRIRKHEKKLLCFKFLFLPELNFMHIIVCSLLAFVGMRAVSQI